jgi:superkiller protein 3
MKKILLITLLLACVNYAEAQINEESKQSIQGEIERYQRDITFNPNDAVAYFCMGEAYMNLENYTEAVSCFRKVIEIEPRYDVDFDIIAEAYFSMGEAYMDLGNYIEAISCFQKIIEIEPNKNVDIIADAYVYMGKAYMNLENYTEAILCYQKIIEIEPNNEYIYYKMAVAYDKLGNKSEHDNCVKKAEQIRKENNNLEHTKRVFRIDRK